MTDVAIIQPTELEKLEGIIERGFKTFVEVGQALATIRDNKLYRDNYATFEDYCQERWKFTRQRAYQLMSAAQFAIGLSTQVDIPNEKIARQLMRLDKPEHQRAALTVAVATAPNGRLTTDWLESTIDVLEDAAGSEGLVDPGANSEWTAMNAAVTHEAHQKMLVKRKQLAAGRQKPVAVFEAPAANFRIFSQANEQMEDIDDAEMMRVVIYKARQP